VSSGAAASGKAPSLDGIVSRYLNRPLSRPVARLLAHTPVTPNQVTVLSLLCALAAGWLLVLDHPVWAGLAIHASSVIDGVDGDLARIAGRATRFGAVFDAVLDRYADAAIFGGMAWRAYQHEPYPAALVVGLAALTGAFAISYSRARAESSAGQSLTGGWLGIASRDVRLLLAAVACLAGQGYLALALIALVSNCNVAARLVYLERRLR
jgi:phosphatidylglycerophosphate synthase